MIEAIMGIDPGANGGIAVYRLKEKGYRVYNMPETVDRLYELISEQMPRRHAEDCPEALAVYVEKVGGFIGGGSFSQGRNLASAHSMFEFGRQYERILCILGILGFEINSVLPSVWQKGVSGPKRREGETLKQWANREAKKFFKGKLLGGNITLKTCDALWICSYGKYLQGV